MTGDFEIRRDWWFPFVVGVWEEIGEGEHFTKGHYTLWKRRGDAFFRVKTARRFIEFYKAQREKAP